MLKINFNKKKMKVWSLIDNKIGSNKQTIALSRALSENVILKKIKYNSFIVLPNFIRYKKLGIDFKKSDILLPEDINEIPDVIIFAGRRLSLLSLYLKEYFKKKFNKIVKIIAILNPNCNFAKFDYIILPAHDNKIADNIIQINGSICEINHDKINKEKIIWEEKLNKYKKPYISLLIGGDTKRKKFDSVKFGIFVKNLSEIIKNKNATLLISTSRRTSKECVNELKNNLSCDNYLFEWKIDTELNPYYGFLSLSDLVIATGDSISMISESLTLKKSVLVYMPKESLGKKHINFCKNLLDKQLIKQITYNVSNLDYFETEGLNELEKIKEKLLFYK